MQTRKIHSTANLARTVLVVLISLGFPLAAIATDHPGNVFVLGDDVTIPIPSTWTAWNAIDIDGKDIGSGKATDGKAALGKLPIGYFEVHEKDGKGLITAAVVAKNTPVENTPIAIDAAMSWIYAEPEQVRDTCTLCKLLGVNWVRDRASWPELEPSRGTWAGDTRYERTMRIEHEQGLKILQVNHISPPWATKNGTHFPDDLRDVYDFYKGLSARWKGLADAIEPWNEPDIIEFGGHTGAEIASFDKAACLGLKAGDPNLVVNDAVFAIDRAETLEEFGWNEVYPYFDRYDLHHYIHLGDYPRAYARHRAVNGGRPMWTTEFNLTIWWADEKTHEPSHDDLRVQGYRVGKVFAEALHEGTQKAFYFMLGDYVEYQLQYGLLHHDMTPRPAFVAFAAVGRLLNGAVPIGRVDLGDDKVKGYLFSTKVDGADRETLVTWSETKPTTIDIPGAEMTYDYLGRVLSHDGKTELTRATVFMLLPPGGSKALKIIPPPAKAPWLDGKASPVVLQLLGKTDFKQSAYLVDQTKELHLVTYNFGTQPASGKLSAEGATDVTGQITIPPGGRDEKTIHVNDPSKVTVRLDLGDGGHALVSARVATTMPTTAPTTASGK